MILPWHSPLSRLPLTNRSILCLAGFIHWNETWLGHKNHNMPCTMSFLIGNKELASTMCVGWHADQRATIVRRNAACFPVLRSSYHDRIWLLRNLASPSDHSSRRALHVRRRPKADFDHCPKY